MHRDLARRLRADLTDAEAFAWKRLRGRQLSGFRFRRQAPVGPYIADFACFEAKLVLELDGGQHAEQVEADAERTGWLAGRGFRAVRFWNHKVFTDWEVIEQELWRLLTDPTAQPVRPETCTTPPTGFAPSPLAGEGGGGGSALPPPDKPPAPAPSAHPPPPPSPARGEGAKRRSR